jgi:Terminase large subunit, T4likevirus-type, N-terminal
VRRSKTARWNPTAPPHDLANLEARYLPHQREVFRDCRARHVVYVKGRRAGGTYGAALRLIELAHRGPPSRHLWVDLTQRHIARYVRRYFAPLLRGSAWRWDARASTLRFAGGSACDFGSAQRPELLEGFGYRYLWINEAGHLLQDEALYFETLLPMVLESPQAQLFFIGTPKGRGLLERMYEWGQDPANQEHQEWHSFRHASSVNPRLSKAWLERIERQMPERAYRQEILAEFIDDAGTVFRDVEARADALPEAAPDPAAPYVIGADLARYRDYSVAWVGRADTGAAVACERWQLLPWPEQQARLTALALRYGDAPLYVDAGGPGDPVCDALEGEGLAVQRVIFTAGMKRRLVEHLALALERGTLHFVPHEPTLHELRAYRYELTAAGNVRTGGYREHDDCVMALALCCWAMAVRSGRDFILGAPMRSRELD